MTHHTMSLSSEDNQIYVSIDRVNKVLVKDQYTTRKILLEQHGRLSEYDELMTRDCRHLTYAKHFEKHVKKDTPYPISGYSVTIEFACYNKDVNLWKGCESFCGGPHPYCSKQVAILTPVKEEKPESDRDDLFEEAAGITVRFQQGSTSLIQRKLKLGYNRAGRLIDQLEAAGIIDAFQDSKIRQVIIKDERSLELLFGFLPVESADNATAFNNAMKTFEACNWPEDYKQENGNELEELRQWKKEQMEVWMPVIDYCQNNKIPGLKVGQSISEFVLHLLRNRNSSPIQVN